MGRRKTRTRGTDAMDVDTSPTGMNFDTGKNKKQAKGIDILTPLTIAEQEYLQQDVDMLHVEHVNDLEGVSPMEIKVENGVSPMEIKVENGVSPMEIKVEPIVGSPNKYHVSGKLYIENEFVLVHASYFMNLPNIMEYLLQDLAGCGGATGTCGFHENCISNYILLKFNKKYNPIIHGVAQIDTILHDIDNRYKEVVGYLILIEFPNISTVEIYDVCALTHARDGKHSNTLLQFVINLYKPHRWKLWLAVYFKNPMWVQVTRRYISLGFTDVNITKKTYGGAEIDRPVLELVYVTTANSKTHKVITDYNIYLVDYLKVISETLLAEPQKLIIDKDKLEIIQKFVNNNNQNETGGTFTYEQKQKQYNLTIGEVVDGSRFSVNVPVSTLTWHTHPAYCLNYGFCYINWPSGADFAAMLHNIQKHHILFSSDGVYEITLTPIAQAIIHALLMYKNGASLLVYLQLWLKDLLRVNIRFQDISYDKLKADCKSYSGQDTYKDNECVAKFVSNMSEHQKLLARARILLAVNKKTFRNIGENIKIPTSIQGDDLILLRYILSLDKCIYNFRYRSWDAVKDTLRTGVKRIIGKTYYNLEKLR